MAVPAPKLQIVSVVVQDAGVAARSVALATPDEIDRPSAMAAGAARNMRDELDLVTLIAHRFRDRARQMRPTIFKK